MQYIINTVSNVDWLTSRSIIFRKYKLAMEYYNDNLKECKECIEYNKVIYAHIQVYSRSSGLAKWKRIIDTVLTKDGLNYSGE